MADDNGFQGYVVNGAGWMCIDPVAVTDWLVQQQARPLPHQRRLAWKRLTPARQREPTAVECGITQRGEPHAESSHAETQERSGVITGASHNCDGVTSTATTL